MGLILRNIDTRAEITVEDGVPLVIGRGDTTGCSDKRVSRKHSQVVCTSENKLQVSALHTNPCFVMKNGEPPILHLLKNEEKILDEGDYLGLLKDAFWYEIIKKDSVNDSKENDSSESNETKFKNQTSKLSVDEPSTSNNTSNLLPKIEVTESGATSIPPELEKTRKLPLWMYEIDEPKETKKSPAKRPHSLTPEESGGKKVKTELSPSMLRTSPSPEKQTSPVQDIKAEVPDQNCNSRQKIELEESQTDSVNVKEAATPKKEDVKTSGGESSKKNEKDGYESDAADTDQPAASSQSPRRPICQYEGSCYRKNPQHRQEYCHPGDSDYVKPESRPQCPYGANCYRQNQMHRVEYQHPTSTPAPRPQPRPQSPASPASPPLPAKRNRKTKSPQPQDSEADDYDLEDPFINDASSDDYAPTESESDEDDEVSDLSQVEREELKRLKKEAKKISKKKKK